MTPLDVTDHLVWEMVRQVGPLVEATTRWNLRLHEMQCRVLPKEAGYEELVLGRLRGAGVCVEANASRGIIERLLEYIIEGNAMGAYEPSTQELMLVRENVDDSNLDGLRVIVGHELVHRGQHVTYPFVFERVNQATRQLVLYLEQARPDMAAIMEVVRSIKPMMSLIESHAYYVQGMLARLHFPNARVETHVSLPALLLRVFGGQKIAQYTDAVPAIAEAAQAGSVDALYGRLR